MNLKKILSLSLSAVLFVALLAGCSAPAEAPAATDAPRQRMRRRARRPRRPSPPRPSPAATGETTGNYADTITIVWYPNESAEDYEVAREEWGRLIEQATGKKVEQKLTTDYAIAIESLANGTAQISFMGAQGYIEAKNANDAVLPLFVNSGASGTLDDALYYSFLAVEKGNEGEYASADGGYSIDNIRGKRMSFVSNSSTSGFKVPTSSILTHFADLGLTEDDLIEGGDDMFFSQVLFGGSHQGSAFNLMSDRSNVSAFCNTEIAPYADCVAGEANTVGSTYAIKADASAPFDTVTRRGVRPHPGDPRFSTAPSPTTPTRSTPRTSRPSRTCSPRTRSRTTS